MYVDELEIPHHSQDGVGIRAIGQIFFGLTEFANAGVIAFIYSHIFNYLEMKMWGPVAILLWFAKVPNNMAAYNVLKLGYPGDVFET